MKTDQRIGYRSGKLSIPQPLSNIKNKLVKFSHCYLHMQLKLAWCICLSTSDHFAKRSIDSWSVWLINNYHCLVSRNIIQSQFIDSIGDCPTTWLTQELLSGHSNILKSRIFNTLWPPICPPIACHYEVNPLRMVFLGLMADYGHVRSPFIYTQIGR